MTNKETKTSVGKLPKPYAEGLKSLVSPKWMAVWNAYLEQRARIVELEQQRDALAGICLEAANSITDILTDTDRITPSHMRQQLDATQDMLRKARALLTEQEQSK